MAGCRAIERIALRSKSDSRRDAMPGRGAGGMGQRNQVEGAAVAAQLERAADDFVELLEGKELRDRKFADRE